jgi:hydroxymethylglutaryl-CoA lyase
MAVLPKSVRIVEVGPRDGLQGWPAFVPTDVKIELIRRLAETGLNYIEATSFVSPQWIPQMRDAGEVIRSVRSLKETAGVHFNVLVPNLRGMEAAIEAQVPEVAVFTAASETFCKKNTNCGIDESFERFVPVIELARAHGIRVRGYISCVMGCPYEGDVAPHAVARVAERLYALGCYEIALGDTTGIGTPGATARLLDAVCPVVPAEALAVHLHDTYGQALVNIREALEYGITTVDASVSGLGGCPYARGALGNVATEDVVYMLHGMGIETGVDLKKLVLVGDYISARLNRTSESRVARALSGKVY